MRFVTFLLCALLLSGCVTTAPRQYQWGSYEDMLYAGYKDTTKMDALKSGLEIQIAQLEKSQQKVAPGLYAELGTLYVQGGLTDKAVVMYGHERDTWPESKGLMDAMIKNLERSKVSAEGSAK